MATTTSTPSSPIKKGLLIVATVFAMVMVIIGIVYFTILASPQTITSNCSGELCSDLPGFIGLLVFFIFIPAAIFGFILNTIGISKIISAHKIKANIARPLGIFILGLAGYIPLVCLIVAVSR